MKIRRVLKRSSIHLTIALLTMAGGTLTLAGQARAEQSGNLYDISTFATIADTPGFPEGIAVHGNNIFVSGPARFGTAGTGPSAIQVYDRTSAQHIQTIQVSGEALGFEHALSNIAVDSDGRLYALSTQLGLIRFVKQGSVYLQQPYGAPLPDLPCTTNTNAFCPPPEVVIPPIPNDIVFDAAGNAYVTDSLQQTIFRYPAGGGAPTVWLQSPLFEGGGPFPFGLNGARIDPMREYLYFAVTTSATNAANGIIYRIPLVSSPSIADLETFHIYNAGEAPDQLAFGANGKLYVSLAFSNQISVLNGDGTEEARISNATNPIPLDAPAGIAFDATRKSLLIANHALLTGSAANFAILKSYVNDPGNPLEKPALP